MKKFIVLVSCLIWSSLGLAIENYRLGDELYVIADKLNVREAANINAAILFTVEFGVVVESLSAKFDKSGDFILDQGKANVDSLLSGKWVKVKQGMREGYIFDLYLSKQNFTEIYDPNKYLELDTLRITDYETYYRYTKSKAVIVEIGTGMEWANESYLIPDISFEEAIIFLKPKFVNFGNRKWNLSNKDREILMTDNGNLTFRDFAIRRVGNYMWINIGESM